MNLENLNENRVEIALRMLSSTDEDHAMLSGHVKYLEEAMKQAKARVFLQAEGTVAERQERALDSILYSDAVKEWIQVYKKFKILDNKRQHEVRVIEIFQTLSANRRKGML
jgi:hypothetical protein